MRRFQQRAAPPPGTDPTEYVMSDESVDRMGDVIVQSGWQLANFKKHPIALFNHDRDQVIGSWRDVRVRDGRLIGKLELADEGTSPLVDTIRKLTEQNILRAVSVGFRPLKSEPLNEEEKFGALRFLKSELMECSLVSVPANPNALAITKGIPRDLLAELFCMSARDNAPPAFAHHGKYAKSLVPQSTNMTLTQKIQAAQKRITELRDKLTELTKLDDLDDEQTKLVDELPDMIEAEETELARLAKVEKALAPKPGSAPQPKPVEGEVIAPADLRTFAVAKKKIE